MDFNDGVARGVPTCTAHADCRQEHGYICDDNDTCWPGDGTVPPGGPCGADAHCQGGADAYCLLHNDFPGGYCVISDCTALLVAKLVASGRIRIIGFEAKVQAGLESAMDDLVTAGVITAAESTPAKSFVTTSLNHSSWIWHFNHMHASFCSGDCPQTKVDGGVRQGPMRDLPLDTQSDLVRAYHQQRQLAP